MIRNAAHHARGETEELRSVGEVDGVLAYQAQVGFVDQGCGLQGVSAAFSGEVVAREAAEFLIDRRSHIVEGRLPRGHSTEFIVTDGNNFAVWCVLGALLGQGEG